ncbi:hypothetical protein BPAE_0052g00070 [Botrytis paeoniae]|uniref:Uncharacterized protein n=1 Tax=Botrytis paeoniae TaxID=278948 RepID=A0A4Z1FV97_9HELO|nr:hypothetical protein BPAE_0052g00070 [Botrytis paeoniae]
MPEILQHEYAWASFTLAFFVSAGNIDIFRSEYQFSELDVGGSAKSLIEPQGALVQMTEL